jgi:hypothetical protein
VQIPCIQWGKPKYFILQGENLKKKLVGSNAKHAHLAGGNDLLTQKAL